MTKETSMKQSEEPESSRVLKIIGLESGERVVDNGIVSDHKERAEALRVTS